MKKKKALFISSTGGHLTELMQLKSLFNEYDYHIVTEKTSNNLKLKNKYGNKISFLIYGTKLNMLSYPFKLLTNFFISLYYFLKYRPYYIITTGTHTAVPMCLIGKIFRRKVVYIETFANAYSKSVAGKFVYNFADLFIVQWESMLKLYPNAKYFGGVF